MIIMMKVTNKFPKPNFLTILLVLEVPEAGKDH